MARVRGGLAAAAVAAVAAAACSGGDALLPGFNWISHTIGVGLATHRMDDLVTQAGFGCSAAGVAGGVPSLLLTALGLIAIALASRRRRARVADARSAAGSRRTCAADCTGSGACAPRRAAVAWCLPPCAA